MITFVCFKWKQAGYRSKFTSDHVNTLYSMLRRHYCGSVNLLCVTDDAVGIHPNIWTMRLYDEHGCLPNASWPAGPSCYRRLRVFAKDFPLPAPLREHTEFLICIDLDVVILGNIQRMLYTTIGRMPTDTLFMWGTGEAHVPVCGSMFGFRADGSMSYVWDTFKGASSAKAAAKTMPGSDQAWLAHCVGIQNICTWTQEDGVYSFGHDLCYGNGKAFAHSKIKVKPPANARIVIFNGKPDPWECLHLPWVKEHYK